MYRSHQVLAAAFPSQTNLEAALQGQGVEAGREWDPARLPWEWPGQHLQTPSLSEPGFINGVYGSP